RHDERPIYISPVQLSLNEPPYFPDSVPGSSRPNIPLPVSDRPPPLQLRPNHFSQDAHDEIHSERDQEGLRTPEPVCPELNPYSQDSSDCIETENIQWRETTPGHSNAH